MQHDRNGIPRYRPFIDFLDEYHHLVREAERRDTAEANKKLQSLQGNWPAVLEEIRRRGTIRRLNSEVEKQRQDLVHDLEAVASNKLGRVATSAMASIHDNRQAVHEELKKIVSEKKTKLQLKEVAIVTHYTDLKDQMVSAFRRKTLALQVRQQMASEVRFRLDQNVKLKDDTIRRQTISNFGVLHRELQHLHNTNKEYIYGGSLPLDTPTINLTEF